MRKKLRPFRCKTCKEFGSCYPVATTSDSWPSTLVDYFNAIRQRDLCVNSELDDYKPIKGVLY